MMVAGPILALDLGTHTGHAIGRAGEVPRSGVVTLKESGEHRQVAFANLIAWMQDKISKERPDLIVKEAPLFINSVASVRSQFGLHAIVEGVAKRFGIPIAEVSVQAVRKHFLGQASAGSRLETKRAVVKRCQLLGYIDRGLADVDDNRADALAVHDWACATYSKRPFGSSVLMMFGER